MKRQRSYGRGSGGRAKKRIRFLRKTKGGYIDEGDPTYFRPSGRRKNYRTGGFLGMEKKFLDCAWNGVAINSSTDGTGAELQPSSGCTSAISVPAQGDGESNRDGRKYIIKKVWVSGLIDTTAASDQADASEMAGWYFALVLDKQCNGATINSEDVYINPSSSASAMAPQPLRNLQQSNRFDILDSCYVQPQGMYAFNDAAATGSLSAQNRPTLSLNWSAKKGPGIICECDGTTADVASVTNKAIHVIAFNANNTATFTSSFFGKSRVRFIG